MNEAAVEVSGAYGAVWFAVCFCGGIFPGILWQIFPLLQLAGCVPVSSPGFGGGDFLVAGHSRGGGWTKAGNAVRWAKRVALASWKNVSAAVFMADDWAREQ